MSTVGSVTGGGTLTAGGANAAADLSSDDFYKLLITQLTNQDPLDPTSNEDLLRQISSIREIELSSTLTDSLRRMTGGQRFSSAAGLIGQYVSSVPGESGETTRGMVVGVRFDADQQPILRLSDGREVAMESVASIESPMRAAESLVGLAVTGLDRRKPSEPRALEGVVSGVRTDEQGDVVLELDTGESLRLRDVVGVGSADA